MPDDPSIRWRVDIVAEVILYHIKSLSIDTVRILFFGCFIFTQIIVHKALFYN